MIQCYKNVKAILFLKYPFKFEIYYVIMYINYCLAKGTHNMSNSRRNIHEVSHDRILKNVNSRTKRSRLIIERIKAALCLVVLAAAVIFILMMTPLFSIKTIGVSGNNIISLSSIESRVGDLTGKNLFRTSKSEVEKHLEGLTYIKGVEISKKPFPPTLYIKIEEIVPAAYFTLDGRRLVLDSEIRVVDDASTVPVNAIPEIIGISEAKYRLGKPLELANAEQLSSLKVFLSSAYSTGLLPSITKIDIGNTLDITFNYDNRLDVRCGSSVELNRKIRMFKETVTNASMKADAQGAVDLSEPGKAIYTPYELSAVDTNLPDKDSKSDTDDKE